MKRIPWLIIGVVAGFIIGGWVLKPYPYAHNIEERLRELYGHLGGMFAGFAVGLGVHLYFRQRR